MQNGYFHQINFSTSFSCIKIDTDNSFCCFKCRTFCLFLTVTLKPFSDPICMATSQKKNKKIKKKASNPLKYLKRHMTTFTACTYYDAWPVLHVTEAIIRRTVPAAV